MLTSEPLRILVVDDELAIVFAITQALRAAGYAVDSARSRAEAEALLDLGGYSLVLTDLRLSPRAELDGLEILSHARRSSTDLRLIVLSAHAAPAIRAEATRRGADAVLDKPLPLARLTAMVGELLGSPA